MATENSAIAMDDVTEAKAVLKEAKQANKSGEVSNTAEPDD